MIIVPDRCIPLLREQRKSLMPFGRHKGAQVEDLVEDRPEYIRWLCENTDTQLDDEETRRR